MEANIRRTEPLVAWSEFLHGQNAQPAIPSNPLEAILRNPVHTEPIDEAKSIFENFESTLQPSEQERFIREALKRMHIANNAVIDEAARLWREGANKDSEARRATLIQSVLASGVAIAGAAAGGQGGAGDQSSIGSAFFYQETWEFNEAPDGGRQIIFRRRGGELPNPG